MVKDKSTRQAILELLKKSKELSVSGLKEHLDITEMAVRKHLVKLEGEGFIQSRTVRQPMGRPVIFYSLTAEGNGLFPNNYDKVVVELLSDIQETMGNEAIDKLFENREQRMRKTYKRHIFQDDRLHERVKQLVRVQQENGYMAEFSQVEGNEELDKQYMTFEQYNCPIAAIADRYDKPCHCELNLFKEVLGTDQVERVSCIAKGEKSCKYVVKETLGKT
ncbi:iron-sulfur cluster biosynthesis transcriptional regulator SufR [Amphibacillus marinus]|uniref:Iron-sulfur cluster biosynthesis transcriptional regulator SufR n=1 Tax=Amphibacillus marinus TaxID=872970 RepID=A0A1H8RKG0_9BACI|nr:metalloregulator ArsR/SmtB family transcription factor [Amphibacillus marinus]SEO66463.1 iron-sulfur cluster biosynthesis transcriptional regulator SufR [Amphibacillus marinus]